MSMAGSTRQVRLVLDSDDFSTAAPFVMYDMVTGATITFVDGMALDIYLLMVSNGATAATIQVFDDIDASGTVQANEILYEHIFAINEQAGFAFVRSFALRRLPKAKASAGSIGGIIIMYAELQASEPIITIKPRV